MTVSLWKKSSSALLTVFILPALALAATAAARPGAYAPSPEVRMDTQWASRLLTHMQTNVARVNNDAAKLQTDYSEGLAWQADVFTLNRIAARVKKMDNELYSLRTIRKDVTPEDAQTIARLAPQVTVLTDEVNSSVHFINNNHHYLWAPKWRNDTNDLYQTSKTVQQDLQRASREQTASLHAPAANVTG
jgi:hypothetical protein